VVFTALRKAECQSDTVTDFLPFWIRQASTTAILGDAAGTNAPAFDEATQKEHLSNVGIMWSGHGAEFELVSADEVARV